MPNDLAQSKTVCVAINLEAFQQRNNSLNQNKMVFITKQVNNDQPSLINVRCKRDV